MLGEDLLKKATKILLNAIYENKRAFLIVDCDTDGYCSAAILINYLYNFFPTWTKYYLTWWMHDSKQHGLGDCIDEALKYDLVICPDSSSNDEKYHQQLYEKGIPVIVLDHHLADVNPKEYEYAVIINNQLSDYPNKEFCGAGIVWQYCRYIDSLMGCYFADELIDLAALANIGDMMSLLSLETKIIIEAGCSYIKNPFIECMAEKNEFSLNKSEYKSHDGRAFTPMGAAFFIVPLINATTRSGTIDEKKLLFESMLTMSAYEKIPEIKYNKPTGKDEFLVSQAIRVIQGVKRRQTKAEDEGLALLERKIEVYNMLEHKMLLFLLEENEVQSEIRGLIANKLMAKYQRPCAILTYKSNDTPPWEEYIPPTYEGSMRGYTKTGIKSFKDICEGYSKLLYCAGHDNAAGLGIKAEDAEEFLRYIDITLQDISTEPLYRVDYIFDENNLRPDIITQIALMNDFWGQDIERALVAMTFKVTENNFTIMKGNTLKFTLPGLTIIKFNGTEEEIDKFTTKGFIEVEAICECCLNEWNGNVSPQLLLKDYNIIDSAKYYF